MKRLIRKSISVIVTVSIFLSTCICAYAADQDIEEGRAFIWSPYVTSHAATASSTRVTVQTDFYFGGVGVNVHNKYSITDKYFTMDHCSYDNNQSVDLDVMDDFIYSNLPNPHFDKDDDKIIPDGCEESEVVALGDLVANIDYYFVTTYSRPSAIANGTVLATAQRSQKFLTEYNTTDYDQLCNDSWVYSNSRNAVSTQSESIYLERTESPARFLNADVCTITELNNYINEQQQLLAATPALVAEEGAPTVTATLTFTRPISMVELSGLLNSTGVELKNYEAKFIDGTGMWVTAFGSRATETELITDARNTLASGGEVLDYCGITSAVVSFDFGQQTYTELQNSELVYFADLSEYLWSISEEYDPTVEPHVSDYAWIVASENT